MIKLGCGAMMVVLGAILALWLAYNLLVARQPEFTLNLGGLLFMSGLFFVGVKWMLEGWPIVQKLFKPKRRKKKKKRPAVEDDSE